MHLAEYYRRPVHNCCEASVNSSSGAARWRPISLRHSMCAIVRFLWLTTDLASPTRNLILQQIHFVHARGNEHGTRKSHCLGYKRRVCRTLLQVNVSTHTSLIPHHNFYEAAPRTLIPHLPTQYMYSLLQHLLHRWRRSRRSIFTHEHHDSVGLDVVAVQITSETDREHLDSSNIS